MKRDNKPLKEIGSTRNSARILRYDKKFGPATAH